METYFILSSREDRPRLAEGGYAGRMLSDFTDKEYKEVFRMEHKNVKEFISKVEPHYQAEEGK